MGEHSFLQRRKVVMELILIVLAVTLEVGTMAEEWSLVETQDGKHQLVEAGLGSLGKGNWNKWTETTIWKMRIIDLVEDILSNAATSVRVMDCVGRIGHKETDGPVSVAMESVIVTRDHVMEFQGPVETVSKKQNVLHLKQRPPVLTPVAGKRVG